MNTPRTSEETIVQVELSSGALVEVNRMSDGSYDVSNAGVVRHTPCSAEDAMRALGHYLHSEAYQLIKLRQSTPSS